MPSVSDRKTYAKCHFQAYDQDQTITLSCNVIPLPFEEPLKSYL